MLRLAEIAFFLVPFALYGAWWYLGRRASAWFLWGGAALLAVLGALTIWYGLETGLPPDQAYVPAELREGVVVPGHGRIKDGH